MARKSAPNRLTRAGGKWLRNNKEDEKPRKKARNNEEHARKNKGTAREHKEQTRNNERTVHNIRPFLLSGGSRGFRCSLN